RLRGRRNLFRRQIDPEKWRISLQTAALVKLALIWWPRAKTRQSSRLAAPWHNSLSGSLQATRRSSYMTAMSTFRAPILKLGVSCRAAICASADIKNFQYANSLYLHHAFRSFLLISRISCHFFLNSASRLSFAASRCFLKYDPAHSPSDPWPFVFEAAFDCPGNCSIIGRSGRPAFRSCSLRPQTSRIDTYLRPRTVTSVSSPRLTSSPTRFVLITRSSAAWA